MNTKLIPRISAWPAAAFPQTPALQADWTFAVPGNTRGDRETTITGVTPHLNILVQIFATRNPNLALMDNHGVNGRPVSGTFPLRNHSLPFDNRKAATATQSLSVTKRT